VMAARGLLSNPALFYGYNATPPECVSDFVRLSLTLGSTQFKTVHSHLMMMLYDVHSQPEKRHFNALRTSAAMLEFLRTKGIHLSPDEQIPRVRCV